MNPRVWVWDKLLRKLSSLYATALDWTHIANVEAPCLEAVTLRGATLLVLMTEVLL